MYSSEQILPMKQLTVHSILISLIALLEQHTAQ